MRAAACRNFLIIAQQQQQQSWSYFSIIKEEFVCCSSRRRRRRRRRRKRVERRLICERGPRRWWMRRPIIERHSASLVLCSVQKLRCCCCDAPRERERERKGATRQTRSFICIYLTVALNWQLITYSKDLIRRSCRSRPGFHSFSLIPSAASYLCCLFALLNQVRRSCFTINRRNNNNAAAVLLLLLLQTREKGLRRKKKTSCCCCCSRWLPSTPISWLISLSLWFRGENVKFK